MNIRELPAYFVKTFLSTFTAKLPLITSHNALNYRHKSWNSKVDKRLQHKD